MSEDSPQSVQELDQDHAAPVATRWGRAWPWVRLALQIGLPLLVVWLAWHEIHSLNLHEVRTHIGEADGRLLGLGVLAVFAAVAVMGLYDAVAFPHGVHGTLSFARRWLLGMVLFGWTNFVSMGPIGGPALRVLAYRRSGLEWSEITRGFVGHYVGTSSGLIGWLAAVWLPGISGSWEFPIRMALALIFSMIFSELIGRLVLPLIRRVGWMESVAAPPLVRLAVVSYFDWGLTLLSFALLTRAVGVVISPVGAGRTMLTGHLAGILSMIPGGIGSADGVWFKGFALLDVGHEAAGAAVLMFRAGFYLLPWVFSLIAFYVVLVRESERFRDWQRRIVAGAVMLNAILLLVSTVMPLLGHRLEGVERFMPFGAIELSRTVATMAAVVMLFLVRGLFHGYRGAYVLSMAMLGAAAAAHPLNGGNVEEALASVILMGMLFGVREAFTRRGRIPLAGELALAGGVGALAFLIVVGISVFDRIPIHESWWPVLLERSASSRLLRVLLLMVIAAMVVLVRQALRPEHVWVTPSRSDIDDAEAFAKAHADSAEALMVGAGDKGVWFWEPKPGERRGLVLFQHSSDKMIVFRDPLLIDEADAPALISALMAHAHTLDMDLVFATISGRWMERLHDFGFHFLKINEEAIVPLTGFTLSGGQHASHRRTLRDMEGAGVTYEVLSPQFSEATIAALRNVSDAWLASKGGHELQFSACCFSPAYMQRNPVGVARTPDGRIIAFVNILTTRAGGPATIDLMRYDPDSIEHVMDFVLIRTMQTLAQQGYTALSLGSAPLSEVGVWRSSRLVERALHLFSTRAERFYNYQGLQMYKSKFHPQWHARYMAYQQVWDWASSLVATVRLVSAHDRRSRRRIAAARLGQTMTD